MYTRRQIDETLTHQASLLKQNFAGAGFAIGHNASNWKCCLVTPDRVHPFIQKLFSLWHDSETVKKPWTRHHTANSSKSIQRVVFFFAVNARYPVEWLSRDLLAVVSYLLGRWVITETLSCFQSKVKANPVYLRQMFTVVPPDAVLLLQDEKRVVWISLRRCEQFF